MPAKIYYDQDADLGLLRGKKVAIIGYGSQGHAHALNLKDSGQDVVVGLYKGSKSWAKAEKDGLKVMTVERRRRRRRHHHDPAARPDPAPGVRGVDQGRRWARARC